MLGRYKKFFFIVFAAFCAFAIFAVVLLFFKKESGNAYKLVSENNVAYITENGKRICQRMVYVTKGSTSEELGESFKDFKFEFTAPYDIEKCALHFRFNKQNLKVYIAQIELKNLTTGKTERSLDLSGTLPDKNMKYWCKGFGKKQLPLTLQNQTENGKKFLLLDIKKPKADEMDGFHLYYKCPPVRKNNKYLVSVKIRANRICQFDLGFRKQCQDYSLLGQIGKDSFNWQIKLAAKAGVDFVTFEIDAPYSQKGKEPDFTAIKAKYDAVLKANPKAKLIPRIRFYPNADWCRANPEAMMRYDNGKIDTKNPSVSSLKYRQYSLKALKALIEFSEKNYGSNMAGYHPTGGNTHEWFYANTWKRELFGYDVSTQIAFRKWLKNKYKSDLNLQKAWGKNLITINSATVPEPAERNSTKELINLQTHANVADFNLFLQDEMADIVILLNRCVKELAPNRLVLSFYGYGCEFSGVYNGPAVSGHYALNKILKSNTADIICGPISYCDRMFGGGKTAMGAAESIASYGKLWLDEDDTSTYLAPEGSYAGAEDEVDTQAKTVKILRRNLSQQFIRNMSSWYMDLFGSGWFADPVLWRQMQKIVELEKRFLKKSFTPEIALVYDEASLCMVGGSGNSAKTSKPLLFDIRPTLNRTAIPFGQYLLSDILENGSSAKINVFSGVYALDKKSRKLLKERTKNTFNIWPWLSGYIDLSENKFSLNAVEELTTFKVTPTSEELEAKAYATKEGLKAGLPKSFGLNKKVQMLVPKVEKGDIVLATLKDKSPAVVVRKNNMFCSITKIPAELFRYAAKLANAPIYSSTGVAVYRNGNFISVCAAKDGVYKIDLFDTYKVCDVFENKEIAQTNSLILTLQKGDIKFYMLKK